MLQFSANLYRIVYGVASNEQTRYYLNGVFVQPAPRGRPGVLLTATDGHRLLCVHDENGKADESAIIGLSAFALKACKDRNVVHIDTGSQVARIYEVSKYVHFDGAIDNPEMLTVLASCGVDGVVTTRTVYDEMYGVECQVTERSRSSDSCRIDGTFPDYRRVIPYVNGAPSQWGGGFNGAYVAAFGKIAGELASHFKSAKTVGTMRMLASDPSSPALILFGSTEAFGVLMPMRVSDAVSVPAWLEPLPEVIAPPPLQITDQRDDDSDNVVAFERYTEAA